MKLLTLILSMLLLSVVLAGIALADKPASKKEEQIVSSKAIYTFSLQ